MILIICFEARCQLQQNVPIVKSGRIDRINNFKSAWVESRIIDIWLPQGYSAENPLPVLYMQDGQMLYDAQQTWNKQSWDIDDIASALIEQGQMRPCIIVGIWNSGSGRHADYFPEKPFMNMNAIQKDTITAQLRRAGRTKDIFIPHSDNYLKFITSELKPYIDSAYAVLKDRKNTFIGGSSMGGLISIYAICEYPDIFGGALCMSTHWTGTFTLEHNPFPEIFLNYLQKKLPAPDEHILYLDCGGKTLDALYPEIQTKADFIIKQAGYRPSNWQTQFFPDADHTEKAWNSRLHIPLLFLLGK
jgi:enterochelin esterase-like enzyme